MVCSVCPKEGLTLHYKSIWLGEEDGVRFHYKDAVFKEPFILVPVSKDLGNPIGLDAATQMGIAVITMRSVEK